MSRRATTGQDNNLNSFSLASYFSTFPLLARLGLELEPELELSLWARDAARVISNDAPLRAIHYWSRERQESATPLLSSSIPFLELADAAAAAEYD